VGVLTEADLVWKGAGAPEEHYVIPPVFIGFADAYVYLRDNKKVESELSKILARTVGEAMSRRGSGRGAGGELLSVSPDAPMSHAAHVMLHHDVSMLPVVEGGDVERVVGVVTQHDILRGLYASSSPIL
jgi:CBS domain-containing protein